MANIKSIGGNPIVLDASGIAAGAVTPDKLEDMGGITAGAALGITGNTTESAAWLQRVTTSDGPTTIRSIHGRTVRWNQLVPTSKSTETASGITMTATNGVYTVTGTGTLDSGSARAVLANIQVPANHKVYASIRRVSTGATNNDGISVADGYTYKFNPNWPTQDASIIFECTTGTVRFFTQPCLTTLTMDMTLTPQLFDLTAMFGSGNEPATVAEFEALYPLPYYAYDAGSLLPVQMEGVETVGRNLFDASAETVGSYATDYEPYWQSERTIPAGTLRSAGSVYDELTETERITRVGAVDMGDLEWVHAASDSPFYYAPIEDAVTATSLQDLCECSTYTPVKSVGTAGMTVDKTVCLQSGGYKRALVRDESYSTSDAATFKTAVSGAMLHYALAEPTVTTYDPPLNLSYRTEQGGTERVMVPTGELSAPPTLVTAQGYTAESLRDAALSAIAPVENGLASTNYGIGSYLVHGGQLCKVTTAIATGESITIGTNVTATTVMAEVLSLTQ